MKKVKHIFEYCILVVFGFFIRLFPLNVVQFFARCLGDIFYFCIPIRRSVALNNLKESFKDTKSPDEIKKIARGAYKQFAQTVFEMIYFPKLTKEDVSRIAKVENSQLIDEALSSGKGAVMVGAHFGNWELMGAALNLHHPVTFVVGQQTNLMVDNIINKNRIGKGMKIIPLKFSLRGVLRALKNNELVAIVSDQDAHEDGAFVDFFGRPASTPKGPAMFALRANSPMLIGNCIRENGKFRVVMDKVMCPDLTNNLDKDIENYTAAYTKILEDYCRQYPDHWFWMHRRWKTKKPQQ